MVTASFDGTRVTAPGSWLEMTTEVFQNLITKWDVGKEIQDKDYLILLNILTGSAFEAIVETPNNTRQIWKIIRFIYDTHIPFLTSPPERLIKIQDKIIEVPTDISSLSIGQSIHLRASLEAEKDMRGSIAIAAAIYLQPLYDDKKFDFESAKRLEKILLQMPAALIYPIGFFFLKMESVSGNRLLTDLSRMTASLEQTKYRLSLRFQKLKGSILLLIWFLSTYIRKDSDSTPMKSTGKQASAQ